MTKKVRTHICTQAQAEKERDDLVEYWQQRGVEVVAWVVPVKGNRSFPAYYAVRSNLTGRENSNG
jgi:hypothetical protein